MKRKSSRSRILCCCIAAILLVAFSISPALAAGSSYIPDDCGNTPCTCFVQLLDHGEFVRRLIDLLKTRGYLFKFENVGQYTVVVENAVKQFQTANGLAPTGTMDDDTLTLLVWEMTPEELDAAMPGSDPETVYVPTDGGIKRHKDSKCSDMYDPRKVSARNAEKLGYTKCRKCWPDADSSSESFAISDFSVIAADVSQITRSAPPGDQQTYVLNKKSKAFHLPSCNGVKTMSEKNKIILDGTRDEIIAMGYHPCQNCNP